MLSVVCLFSSAQAQNGQFIKNAGQIIDGNGGAHPEVLYMESTKSAFLYFNATGVSYVYAKTHQRKTPADSLVKDSLFRADLSFLNTNPAVQIIPGAASGAVFGYHLGGGNPNAVNLQGYTSITYKNLWDKIDMTVSDNGGPVYEFIVNAGGDPNNIQFAFNGALGASITANGIQANTLAGPINLPMPTAVQNVSETSGIPIPVVYTQQGASFGISTQGVQTLTGGSTIISIGCPKCPSACLNCTDISMNWMSYYGGSSTDEITDIGYDANNNVYVAGTSYSGATLPSGIGGYSPSTFGLGDVFITRIGFDKGLTNTDWYGGTKYDQAGQMYVSSGGMVYLTGFTKSNNFYTFPGVSNSYIQSLSGNYNAFLIKASYGATGNTFATCFGSNSSEGHGVYVNSAGDIFLVGDVASTGTVPLMNLPGAYNSSSLGSDDGFIAKFDMDGVQKWTTYIGGGGEDHAYHVTIDGSDNLYVTGYTYSSNILLKDPGSAYQQSYGGNNSGDMFIQKFTSGGALNWSTYLGGSLDEYPINLNIRGRAIDTDNSGNFYITGTSNSKDFPTITPTGAYSQAPGGDQDATITKFSSGGEMVWSTYFGGNLKDAGFALNIDKNLNFVHLGGTTNSGNLPVLVTQGYNQVKKGAGYDGFLASFTTNGVRKWSTYFGGNLNEQVNSITGTGSNFFVCGSTLSSDLPTRNNIHYYYQNNNKGQQEGFMGSMVETVFPVQPPLKKANETVSLNPSLLAYPNPGNGNLFIKNTNDISGMIKISNSLGQILFNRPIESNQEIQINTGLPKGVYLLEFETVTTSEKQKIVVQ